MQQGGVEFTSQFEDDDVSPCSEEEIVNPQEANELPPANPLIEKPRIKQIVVKSVYQFPFYKLPDDLDYGINSQQRIMSFQIKGNKQTVLDKQEVTLQEYYTLFKENICYQKNDQSTLENPTKIGDQIYFATSLYDLNKPKINKAKGMLAFSTSQPCQGIQFSSQFESGNLFAVLEREPNSFYDLVLQNDLNTKGNTQWFFFCIEGAKQGQFITMRILNLYKSSSLFSRGLLPAIYSSKEGTGWVRGGFDVSYRKGFIKKSTSKIYTFKNAEDRVFFAHSYPYTYTRLQKVLNSIVEDPQTGIHTIRRTVTRTLCGNHCDMLTITSNNMNLRQERKGIFLFGRQHPGESQSSFVIEGILRFLTSNAIEAQYLRQTCLFKIFPMINPDGVIHGNYRTSLCGQDLNRQWKKPQKRLHPEIVAIRQVLTDFNLKRKVRFVCDMHGHSKKKFAFFYGNSSKDQISSRLFPYLLSKINNNISYSYSTFRSSDQSKEATARVQIWKELKVPQIFTLESSFMGGTSEKSLEHFSIQDYMKIGEDLCLTLYQLAYDEFGPLDVVQDARRSDLSQMFDLAQKELKDKKMKNEICDDQPDSGSDSQPSEDEFVLEEIGQLFPKSIFQRKQQIKAEMQKALKEETVQKIIIPANISKRPSKLKLEFQCDKIVRARKDSKPTIIQSPVSIRSIQFNQDPLKIVMVDKQVQTEAYLYRYWLIQQKNFQQQLKQQPENVRVGIQHKFYANFQYQLASPQVRRLPNKRDDNMLCVTGANISKDRRPVYGQKRFNQQGLKQINQQDSSLEIKQDYLKKVVSNSSDRQQAIIKLNKRSEISVDERHSDYYMQPRQSQNTKQLPKLKTAREQAENLYYLPNFQSQQSPKSQERNQQNFFNFSK